MKWNQKRIAWMMATVLVVAVAIGSIALWPRQEMQNQYLPEIQRPSYQNSAYKLSAQTFSSDKDAAVDAAVAQVLAELDVWDASDYEKVKAVHYYVCMHVEYDRDAYNDPYSDGMEHTIYNALFKGKAVCDGYAKLMDRLMRELGLECDIMYGFAGGAHAWNTVCLDGYYYLVDATWDANGFDEEPDGLYFLTTYQEYSEIAIMLMDDAWLESHPMAQERYLQDCTGAYPNGITWELDAEARVLTISGEGELPEGLERWEGWRQFRYGISGIIISEGISSIESYAFAECGNVRWVQFPQTLTSIGYGAFSRCESITEMELPNSLHTIGDSAFILCSGLQKLTIPASVEQIGHFAFSSCTGLRSLSFEGQVGTIGEWAFAGCDSLCFVHVAAIPARVEDFAFDSTLLEAYIHSAYFDREEDALQITGWGTSFVCSGILSRGGSIGVPATTGELSSFVTDKLPITSEITYKGKAYRLYSDHICAWAACTEGDSACRYCIICDARKDGNPTAHTYTAVVTEPGCLDGYTTYTCTDCGDSYRDHFVPALGHHFSEWEVTVPNNCTDDGIQVRVCTLCGTQEEAVLSRAHIWGEWYVTKEAGCGTLKQPGEQRRDCARCGKQEIDWIINRGHAHVAGEVTAPTCTSWGYTTYNCACGDTYISDYTATIDHVYAVFSITEPTCTHGGYTTYACVACGDSYNGDFVGSKPHSYLIEIVTEPTCTKSGLERWSCTDCDTVVEYYLDPKGHKMGEWEVVTVADCIHYGEERKYCQNCDYYEFRFESAKGHNYVVTVVEPTCEEKGYTEHRCACGDCYYTDEVSPTWHANSIVVPISEPTCTQWGQAYLSCPDCGYEGEPFKFYMPTGHTEVIIPAIEPTCTEDGRTEGKYCSVCNEVLQEQYWRQATGHAFGEWYVYREATCHQEGEQRRDCANCGAYETVTLPMADHMYETAYIQPTCTERGYTIFTCALCGDQYIEYDETEPSHVMGWWTVTKQPTCAEKGMEERTCSRCEYVQSREVAELDHQYSSVVIPPTCAVDGYTVYVCANCGASYTGDHVAALGHRYENTTISEPTCTEAGFITYSCRCGDSYTEETAALGHTEVIDPAVYPTCTQPGLTEGVHCVVCGAVLIERQEIAAQGHEYYQSFKLYPNCTEDGYCVYTCWFCEESYSQVLPALGHTYESVTVAPTCTEEGGITYRCHCGHTYTEKLAAVGHSFVDGTCQHCGATEAMVGDVNGDGKVNARDARLLLRYAAGLIDEEALDMMAADLNGDGRVNARDARDVLRMAAGII